RGGGRGGRSGPPTPPPPSGPQRRRPPPAALPPSPPCRPELSRSHCGPLQLYGIIAGGSPPAPRSTPPSFPRRVAPWRRQPAGAVSPSLRRPSHEHRNRLGPPPDRGPPPAARRPPLREPQPRPPRPGRRRLPQG